MLQNITKDQLNWIKYNLLVAVVIVQWVALGIITKHYWDKDEAESTRKEKQLEEKDEVIKIYREATMRAAEIEKQSRILKELK